MSAPKWKPYPKYSDKGIDWLGEVPRHWEISTPRLMFEEIKDKNTDSARTNFLSLVSKKGIIPYEEKGSMGNKMSVNIDHYTLVNKGDFVLNSMNFGIGGFGVSDYDGITSPAYVVLRPSVEESLTRYLAKIFEDEGFQKGTAILGDGIMELRKAIGWKHLKRQPIPIPTDEEREAIARFLESGTQAIDELIPALQKQIELLTEYRIALISAAVTGKIDVR
ncbi:MAG: restriction endonuclease subunit S [Candidatus Poseidoniaceae archaeon]